MTEQAEITVKFKIIELLHIYDELIIAHDYGDDETKKICVYLCKQIWNQIPEFEESKNFPKLFIPE
jgi:hypothetical protein